MSESTRHGLGVVTERLVHIYHSEGHDVAALSGVDLTIAAGEFMGLLGPSGAGKSTLLGILAGMFRPSAGKVHVGQADLSRASADEIDRIRAQDVSLMLQGAARNLLPYLTPVQNVAFAQQRARQIGRADLAGPDEVLEMVGLSDDAHRPLAQLTPGHLQLAAVGVAIAPGPGVLLADEPTSQLDHAARDQVLATFGRLNRTLGTTVIVVTHDPEVARSLPRTVTIRDGRIGGEGRSGVEFAVVTEDGSLPLPEHVVADLPPGTLVRLEPDGASYRIVPEEGS